METEVWTRQLSDLAASWSHIVGRADDVPMWRERLDHLREEQGKLVNEGRWRSGPTDFLSVIGQRHRETYHSAVIAWLARPEGHHGLGDRFTRRLVSACGASPLLDGGGSRASVATEVVSGSCRADIVITTSSGRLLIENKTGAPEGANQLESYYTEFEDGATHFAFLSPTGRPPIQAGASLDAWTCISYRRIRDALREAISETGAAEAPALDVARSYLSSLEDLYP